MTGSVDRSRSHLTADPPQSAVDLNTHRKQSSSDQHRKSSQRSSTGLRRHDRKSTSSSSSSSSDGGRLEPPSGGASSKASRRDTTDGDIDSAAAAETAPRGKDSKPTPTSPKRPRTAADCEPPDTANESVEKRQQRQDGGEVSAAATPPVIHARGNLTSLRCGSCGAQFDSLYCLTVHLEETGHKPASDVAVLPTPSPPVASPPSSDHRRTVVVSPVSAPAAAAAPQRLVRGQDVWLARGVEQTDRILRCIQCNAPARSLAELTLHMVHTRHYINIVGPTASTTTSSPCVQPTSCRDKPADTTTSLTTRNGLTPDTGSCKRHGLTSTNVVCRDGQCDDEQTKSVFIAGCAAREDDTHDSTGTEEVANPAAHRERVGVVSPASKKQRTRGDEKRQRATTERSAAFCVRNLIAANGEIDDDDDSGSGSLPLTTTSSLTSRRRRDVVVSSSSSVRRQEVTSSSDERPSPAAPVNSRLPSETAVLGHDVISA